jgi:hypothetical protein
MAGVYVVNRLAVATSTAISIIQVKAGAANPLEILRASVWQSSSTTNAYARIQLLRKSAAATVSSVTPLLFNPGFPAAGAVGGTAATGITASAEGTDGDILIEENFSILSGWLYSPVPEERPYVAAGGIIALKFPAAPTSATYSAQIIFREF